MVKVVVVFQRMVVKDSYDNLNRPAATVEITGIASQEREYPLETV